MKFGISLPLVHQMPGQDAWQMSEDPAPIVAVARQADELGFAWLPCSDHALVPARLAPVMGATWYDPATTLAFVAAITQRVRLLTHVIVLPYHHPAHVAKQYATLDRLSGGRVILGVGAGHLGPEFRALGAPFEERGAVADESLRIIKSLWTQEEVSFAGERYEFSEMMLAPRPVQRPHPPVWVGGNSRRAARRAVELGDGWVPFQVSLEELKERLDYARRLPAFERAAAFDIVVPATVELTAKPLDGERASFAGSPEQVIDDFRAYQELGVTGATVGLRSHSLDDYLEQMERFAREVMPPLS